MLRCTIVFWGRIAGFADCHAQYVDRFLLPLRRVCVVSDVILAHNPLNSGDDVETFRRLYSVTRFISVAGCDGELPFPEFRKSSTYMFRCWQAAADAIDHTVDLVISLRADMLFLTPVDASVFTVPAASVVRIPQYAHFRQFLTDQAMIGRPDDVARVMKSVLSHDVCESYRRHILTRGKMYEPEEHLEHTLRALGMTAITIPFQHLLYTLWGKPFTYRNDPTDMMILRQFSKQLSHVAATYIECGVFTDAETEAIAAAITQLGYARKSGRVIELVGRFRELTDGHNMAILRALRPPVDVFTESEASADPDQP